MSLDLAHSSHLVRIFMWQGFGSARTAAALPFYWQAPWPALLVPHHPVPAASTWSAAEDRHRGSAQHARPAPTAHRQASPDLVETVVDFIRADAGNIDSANNVVHKFHANKKQISVYKNKRFELSFYMYNTDKVSSDRATCFRDLAPESQLPRDLTTNIQFQVNTNIIRWYLASRVWIWRSSFL